MTDQYIFLVNNKKNKPKQNDTQQMNSKNQDSHLKSLDALIKTRLKFGSYQYRTLTLLGFGAFILGAESLFSILLPVILMQQKKHDNNDVMIVWQIYYLGLFCGPFLTRQLIKIFSIRHIITIGFWSQIFFFIAIGLIDDLEQLFYLRFVNGLVIGVYDFTIYQINSENSCKNLKKECNFILILFKNFGKFYLILLMSFFMENFSKGSYKAVSISLTLPTILVYISQQFFSNESLFYLVHKKAKFALAEDIFNQIGESNNINFKQMNTDERSALNKFYTNQLVKKNKIIQNMWQVPNIGLLTIACTLSLLTYNSFIQIFPFHLVSSIVGMVVLGKCIFAEIIALILVYIITNQTQIQQQQFIKYALIVTMITLPLLFVYLEEFFSFLIPILVLLFNFSLGYLVITISQYIDKKNQKNFLMYMFYIDRFTKFTVPVVVYNYQEEKQNYFGYITILLIFQQILYVYTTNNDEIKQEYKQLSQNEGDYENNTNNQEEANPKNVLKNVQKKERKKEKASFQTLSDKSKYSGRSNNLHDQEIKLKDKVEIKDSDKFDSFEEYQSCQEDYWKDQQKDSDNSILQ